MKIPVPTIVPPSRWRRRSAVDILELAATTDRLLVPIERPLATVAVLPPTGEYRHPRNGQVNVPREYAVAILRSFREHPKSIPITYADRDGQAGNVIDLVSSPQRDLAAIISWTPEGLEALKEEGYRYIAPVFEHSETFCLAALALVRPPIAGSGLPFPLVLDGSGLLNGEPSDGTTPGRGRLAATTTVLAVAGSIASVAALRSRRLKESHDERN